MSEPLTVAVQTLLSHLLTILLIVRTRVQLWLTFFGFTFLYQ